MNNIYGRTPNVLVVDDSIFFIHSIVSLLAEKGMNIQTANNGREALVCVQNKIPDIIILDVCMPELDGFEVCKILRANKKYNNIPIIFSTSSTDSESIIKGFQIGGQDYITKPFNAYEFLARVETHLKLKLQMDEEINQKEKYFRGLFEHMAMGTAIVDNNGYIAQINPEFKRMFNYSEEQLLDMKFEELIYEDDKEIGLVSYNDLFEGRCESFIIERRFCNKYGNIVWGSQTLSLVHNIDNSTSLIVMIQDITSRKKVEKELIEAKKAAEGANALKNQFLANMSHELRTPINIIFSALQLFELMLRNNLEIDLVNCDRHLQAMKQNCYRLLRLVNNLIDITKVETGFMELHLKNVNIVSLVEDITLSVAEYAKGKEIEVLFDTEIEEKIVSVDPDKIERIMLNLLSNATKFTNKNGKVSVNIYEQPKKIQISVKDNGIGIPYDKTKDIFDRFTQVDNTFIKNNEGSGIGLSIVKSFVEMHSGTISVNSQVGVGTEFIIEFPTNIVYQEEQYDINFLEKKQHHVEMLDIEFSDIYI